MDYVKFEEIKAIIVERQSLYSAQMQQDVVIPNADINRLLELANFAPSHRRTQPWRFVVFERVQLSKLYNELALIYTKSTPKAELIESKVSKIKNRATQLSHAVVICMKRDEKESVPVQEEEYAVACAVQNMLLGMKSLNIIGYWSSAKMCYSNEFKQFLNLGEKDKCLGILQLGVPKVDLSEIPRLMNGPVEEKVEWRS